MVYRYISDTFSLITIRYGYRPKTGESSILKHLILYCSLEGHDYDAGKFIDLANGYIVPFKGSIVEEMEKFPREKS